MRRRRRAVSLLSIALLLVWLGTLLVAYHSRQLRLQAEARNERMKTVPALLRERERLQREVSDLLGLIGEPGSSPERALQLAREALARLNRGLFSDRTRKLETLREALAELSSTRDALERERKELLAAIEAAAKPPAVEAQAWLDALQQAIRAQKERLAELIEYGEALEEALPVQTADLAAHKAASRAAIQAIEKETEQARIAGEDRLRSLRRDIQILRLRELGFLGRHEPGVEPRRPWRAVSARELPFLTSGARDGEVLSVQGEGEAQISLGSRHQVVPGLRFFVFGPGHDGLEFRGTVEVTKVLEHVSQVRRVRQASESPPLARGDAIFNPLFRQPSERRRPVRLAFVGQFPRFGPARADVGRRLAQMGVDVQQRVTHATDLVIVEAGFETAPDFKKAVGDLDLPVLTAEQLRELLRY